MATIQWELQLIPNKAQYKPGEAIIIKVSTGAWIPSELSVQWIVCDLDQQLLGGEGRLDNTCEIRLPAILEGSGAYGFFATITTMEGDVLQAETAFDVASHWNESPRYGFLSDFAPGEGEDGSDIDFLNRHHINVVQFYDWMYRHDQLVPDTNEFVDPLGRLTSLDVICSKIAGLKAHGIASMAYAAVYASLRSYMELHPEQLLYAKDGQPFSLGNFFYIMDISPNSEWTVHIINEFMKVIDLGFDGLHLDQYGFPKKAIRRINGQEEVVALKEMYPAFIELTREATDQKSPDIGLIFNNVSNYPVHTTANASQDAIYIEVWEPMERLNDLKLLIDRGRELSGKQVILAAYLPAFHPERPIPREEAEAGATLVMATIFASGGYHLLLGEHENILTENYYPKYGHISDAFKQTITHYYDFIVMYRHLLYDLQLEDISMTHTGGINTEVTFIKAGVTFTPNEQVDTVWTIIKEKPGYLLIHAINLCGIDNDKWDKGKKCAPTPLTGIEVTVEMLDEVEGVFWATPDGTTIRPGLITYEWITKEGYSGKYVRFVLPSIAYWSMIYIKLKAGN